MIAEAWRFMRAWNRPKLSRDSSCVLEFNRSLWLLIIKLLLLLLMLFYSRRVSFKILVQTLMHTEDSLSIGSGYSLSWSCSHITGKNVFNFVSKKRHYFCEATSIFTLWFGMLISVILNELLLSHVTAEALEKWIWLLPKMRVRSNLICNVVLPKLLLVFDVIWVL